MSNKTTPLVSVILTTFNVYKYVDRSLADIINQTYDKLEIIVVDDGSTDGTQELLKGFASRDPRIKLFLLKENSPGGVAHAANIGLQNFSGDYVCFADGDDLFSNDYVERLVSTALLDNSDLVICDFLEYDNSLSKTAAPYDPYWHQLYPKRLLEVNDISERRKLLKLNPVPWRKLYRREFIRKNRISFWECEYFFEDNSFHWFNILNCGRVSFVFDKLVWHRLNRKGQTMSASSKMMLGLLYQHSVILKYLDQCKKLEIYKNDALEWLVTSAVYLMEILPSNIQRDFFNELSKELKNYTRQEIRTVFTKNHYELKIDNLFFAIISEDFLLFQRTIEHDYGMPLLQRIRKNYILLNKSAFLKKCIKKVICGIVNKFRFQSEPTSSLHDSLTELSNNIRLNAKIEVLNKITEQ